MFLHIRPIFPAIKNPTLALKMYLASQTQKWSSIYKKKAQTGAHHRKFHFMGPAFQACQIFQHYTKTMFFIAFTPVAPSSVKFRVGKFILTHCSLGNWSGVTLGQAGGLYRSGLSYLPLVLEAWRRFLKLVGGGLKVLICIVMGIWPIPRQETWVSP